MSSNQSGPWIRHEVSYCAKRGPCVCASTNGAIITRNINEQLALILKMSPGIFPNYFRFRFCSISLFFKFSLSHAYFFSPFFSLFFLPHSLSVFLSMCLFLSQNSLFHRKRSPFYLIILLGIFSFLWVVNPIQSAKVGRVFFNILYCISSSCSPLLSFSISYSYHVSCDLSFFSFFHPVSFSRCHVLAFLLHAPSLHLAHFFSFCLSLYFFHRHFISFSQFLVPSLFFAAPILVILSAFISVFLCSQFPFPRDHTLSFSLPSPQSFFFIHPAPFYFVKHNISPIICVPFSLYFFQPCLSSET